MNNLLNLGLSDDVTSFQRTLKIIDIKQKEVLLKNEEPASKVIFETIEPSTGKKFTITDAWIQNKYNENDKRVAGIWLTLENNEIRKGSTLAKLLLRYEASTLGDLIGNTLEAFPDKNNFLVFTTCEL